MAANNIATGGIVITASADPAVKELEKAKAAVNAWGVQAQASMKASSASLSSLMSAAYQKHNDSLANKMQSAWAAMKARSAAAAADMKANLDRMKADAEHFSNKTQLSIDTSGLMAGIEKAKKAQTNLGRDMLKAGKLGGIGELSAGAAIAALGMQVGRGFEQGELEAINKKLERRLQLEEQIGAAQIEASRKRLERFENLPANEKSAAEIRDHLESAKRSLEGSNTALAKQREELNAILNSDLNKAAKGLFVNGPLSVLPYVGESLTARQKELEEQIKSAEGNAERQKQLIEQYNALLEKMKTPQTQFNLPLIADIGKVALDEAKRIRENTEAAIKNLREAHDLMGVDSGEAAVRQAQNAGETDQQKLAEIRLRAEANARKQATVAIDEQLKAMELEVAAYGMTEEAAKRFQLVQSGATADQLKKFDALNEKARAMRDSLEALKAPKVAGAVLAGTEQAYAVEVRMKGFDIGDGNAINKENGKKLDKMNEQNNELLGEVRGMKAAIVAVAGI